MPRPPTTLPLWRSLARLLGALTAVCAVMLLPAAPASAHTALVGTDPVNGAVLAAPPDAISLTFDETVRLPPGGVTLFAADGQVLESTGSAADEVVRVDLPGALGAGTYLLSWRVVSDDGHPLAGTLSFSVDRPSRTVVAATVPDLAGESTFRLRSVVQGAHYVALLLAAGLVAFYLMLPSTTPVRITRRLRRAIGGSAMVAVLSGIALVPLSAAAKLGRGVPTLVTTAGWDPGFVGREMLVASLVAAGLLVAVLFPRRDGVRARRLALGGAAVALVAPSLVGHTRSVDPQPVLIATDALHLVAGAIWFGGLVGLALTLRALQGDAAARVLSRFSTAAAFSLIVLVTMGTVLAVRILSSWDNFVHTTYGVLLLMKIGAVGVAVLIAVFNRYVLLPRVRESGRRGEPDRAPGMIRKAIITEAALLAAVLLTTGFLVDQAPHPQPQPVVQGQGHGHPSATAP